MKKLLFFSLLFFSSATHCESNTVSYKSRLPLYKSGWHLLEDVLIVQPQNAANDVESLLHDGLLGLGSSIIAYAAMKLFVNDPDHIHNKKINLFTLFSIPAAAYLSNTAFYNVRFNACRNRNIARLLEEWNDLKGFLPTETLDCITALQGSIANKPANFELYNESVRLLTARIHEHFAGKYKDEKPFSLRNLNIKNSLAISKFVMDFAK